MNINEQPSTTHSYAPAIIYMSGDRRGTTELLNESTRFITREGRSGVRISMPREMPDPDVAAILHRAADTYELEVTPDYQVWVNGHPVKTRTLESGDVLEIGRNGPMLRYRIYRDGVIPRRTMSDVFADCVDGARYEKGPLVRKTGILIGGVTNEFLVRTTLPFRLAVVVSLLVMIATITFLVWQNVRLEERVARGETEMMSLSALIHETESRAITQEDLVEMRGELEVDISTAFERVEALEARFGAAARIVAEASRSVVFLQGAYGFRHAESGRVLRYLQDPGGQAAQSALGGGRAVTLEGDGPPVELQFTGTGFVATEDGLLITNRHVAEPWEDEDFTAVTAAMGLSPYVQRFIGYLPGFERSFEVAMLRAGEDADIAILRCTGVAGEVPPLLPARARPQPGDGVIVLGYPTGVRAMLARTDRQFLDQLRAQGDLDFWSVGEQLARAGHIQPLATRGIVGQVTPSAVVYDAVTTHGGSGGPVLDLEGSVIAVNSAVLKEFGGSNLGVPIDRATALFSEMAAER